MGKETKIVPSSYKQKIEDYKTAILLQCTGEKAFEIYNNTQGLLANPDDRTLAEVLPAFRSYCEHRKNPVFQRYQFWQLKYN